MNRRLPARVGRALRLCLADHDAAGEQLRGLVEGDGLAGLAAAARHHRVDGYVYRRLRELASAHDELPELSQRYQLTAANHLRVLADLDRTGQVLDDAGVTWLVVKGPVLAESLHGDPGLRPYADLDLVVRGDQLGSAVTALEDAGFTTLDRNWRLLRQDLKGELHCAAPLGTVIDLHWHLIHDETVRRNFSVPMLALLERARRVDVAGRSVRTLDPVDTVLHLGLHTTLAGADRLLWFKDLERAVAAGPPWADVVARARAWDVELPVGTALATTRRLIDASLEEGKLRALGASSGWLALTRLAALAAPPERSVGHGSPYRVLARATRGGAAASLAECTRRSARWIGHRGQVTGRDPRVRADPDNPSSMFHPVDDGDRQLFFEAVARSVRSGGR